MSVETTHPQEERRFDQRLRMSVDQETVDLLIALANRLSTSRASVVRRAVRLLAEREGVEVNR